MILQHLTVTDDVRSLNLYARGDCVSLPQMLKKGSSVDFDTFFNCFSLTKWKRHCDLHNLSFECITSGTVRIELMLFCDGVVTTLLSETACGNEHISALRISDQYDRGLVFIRIISLEDESSIISGVFKCDEPESCCRVAIDMCTYDREPFVEKSMSIIRNSFSKYGTRYSENVELFVVDNASSLKVECDDDRIHIIKNKNLGGSGGFARGLFEIRKKNSFDRIVFMDDDVEFDCESIYRLWAFSSMLRSECKNATICGAMLNMNERTVVCEATSRYVGYGNEPLFRNEDVSTVESCVAFDRLTEGDYGGWWMFSSPFLGEGDYPLPLFMNGDDQEYGLRHRTNNVILNGICVWHMPLDSKGGVLKRYFTLRNGLIISTLNNSKEQFLKYQFKLAVMEALCHRYKYAELFCTAINDYLKGVENTFSTDADYYYHKISKMGYVFGPTSSLNSEIIEKKRNRITTMLTLNGALLHSRGTCIIDDDYPETSKCFRKKNVIFRSKEGEYNAELDRVQLIHSLFNLFIARIKLIVHSGKAEEYRKTRPHYTSEEYWKKRFF